MKAQSLKNKVAVVTGAGSGIGAAIAKALAVEGCAVAACGRRVTAVRSALREIPPDRLLALVCDVREEASVKKFFREVERRFGRVDFLVNNAGVAHAMKPVMKLDARTWRNVLDTNLTGIFLCTQATLGLMRRGGVVVNNLSIASQRVFSGMAAYNASKHGALALTNTLREELREKGIRVVALIPGPTATDIWNQFLPEARRSSMMPPEAVAAMVVQALKMPGNTVVEEIRLMPPGGTV